MRTTPELVVAESSPELDQLLHNPNQNGWHYPSGPPEFWQYADRLLHPGGKLLDLGASVGGSCLFFALQGMHVTAIDNNPEQLTHLERAVAPLRSVLPIALECQNVDFLEESLAEQTYDTTIMSHVVHMSSRETGRKLLERAYATLKPGGHLWLRVPGKHAGEYAQMRYASRWESMIHVVDEHIIEMPCSCSGEFQVEPVMFWDPLEPQSLLAELGAKIVHSQTIATPGRMNFMFGEDYNRHDGDQDDGFGQLQDIVGGMITVVAQKPDTWR